MAENSAQEKTEEASPKRVRESAERGEIARSRELNSFVLVFLGSVALFLSGEQLMLSLSQISIHSIELASSNYTDGQAMIDAIIYACESAIIALLPFLAACMIAVVIGSVVYSGWNISWKALAWKGSRLNPISGIKKMFSINGLVELAKSLAKFFLLSAVFVGFAIASNAMILDLGRAHVNTAIVDLGRLSFYVMLSMSAGLALVALVDAPYQKWSHSKNLRMTKQETKDEQKETDGNPQVKAKIKQQQLALTKGRMFVELVEADVVIVNPEHFAVALKYKPGDSVAPLVVAKGIDFVALRIRSIAKENSIPVIQSPVLARALYYSTELDQNVPEKLFAAVAKVLAHIYQLNNMGKTVTEDRIDFDPSEIPR